MLDMTIGGTRCLYIGVLLDVECRVMLGAIVVDQVRKSCCSKKMCNDKIRNCFNRIRKCMCNVRNLI